MTNIPVASAIRMVLSDVGYTNALPTWFNLHVDSKKRADDIAKLVSQYTTQIPAAPFPVNVPKRYGGNRKWVIPSVNDQMVLQACALSLTIAIENALDRKKVFSHRLNADSSKPSQFLQDQCDGYAEFQGQAGLRKCTHVTILDLENAFASVDRKKQFMPFIRKNSPDTTVADVLEHLLQGFSGNESGIPLVNDSLFYLGNGYFSEVDAAIGKYVTTDFVRFVDEYRFFANSQKDAEALARAGSQQLNALAFRINDLKTKILQVPLPQAEEY